jgi:hypothetical protein
MQELRWTDFDGQEGMVYQVETEGGAFALALEAAVELPPSGRAEG